jgi:histidinol dehydrogenase
MNPMIKVLNSEKLDFEAKIKKLNNRRFQTTPAIEDDVKRVLQRVKQEGDAALSALAKEREGVELRPGQFSVKKDDLYALADQADQNLVLEIEKAIFNITAYHKRQLKQSWEFPHDGSILGQRIEPLDSVGIYIQAKLGTSLATLLMCALPAKLAGVPRIVVMAATQEIVHSPVLAAALRMLHLGEVYTLGGPQAIAALAYGTETIPPVDKIVGPGDAHVSCAKKLLFGQVGIDMLSGPSQTVILADSAANPKFIAADMLSQAEQDETSASICITDSRAHAALIEAEIALQLKKLERHKAIEKSLSAGSAIVIVPNLFRGLEIVNKLAPERVQLLVEYAERIVDRIKNTAVIFYGPYSSTSIVDYFAGPNSIQPGCGTARFTSALGVYDFVKRISIINYSKEALAENLENLERLARSGGLDAHANSLRIRLEE